MKLQELRGKGNITRFFFKSNELDSKITMYINYSSTKLTNEEFKDKPELKVPYHFGRNHPTPYCSDDKQIVSL